MAEKTQLELFKQDEKKIQRLARHLGHLERDEIDALTHRNAMRHFDFDPFAHRPPERSTVAALRAEAIGVDVGPTEPRVAFTPPDRPLTLMDLLSRAEHPLLDKQASTEGVGPESRSTE